MTTKLKYIKLSEFIVAKKQELQKQYTNVRVQSYKAATFANGKIGTITNPKTTSLIKNGREVTSEQFPPGATTGKENGTIVVFQMCKINDLYATYTEQYYFLWK